MGASLRARVWRLGCRPRAPHCRGRRGPADAPLAVDVLQHTIAVLDVVLPLAVVLVAIGEGVNAAAVHFAIDPLALVHAAVGIEVLAVSYRGRRRQGQRGRGLRSARTGRSPCILPSDQSPSYFSAEPPSTAAYVTVPLPCLRSSFQSPSYWSPSAYV